LRRWNHVAEPKPFNPLPPVDRSYSVKTEASILKEMPTKQQLIEDPMEYINNGIQLRIEIPAFKDLDALNEYLMERYNFEVGGNLKEECEKEESEEGEEEEECDEENPYEEDDEYEKLFYGALIKDLRNYVGFLWGESDLPYVIDAGFIEFIFLPRFFVGSGSGKDYKYDCLEENWKDTYWKKIIEDADIIEIS
jgi:hypothetical protein